MDRIQIAEKNAQNAFQENFNPGRIGGLLLYFVGTNAAGQTGAFSDLGDIVVRRTGQGQIVDASIKQLADKGNILAGSNLFSSTDSAAFVASVHVPFSVKSFPQALNVTGDTELNIQWQPGANQSAVFDSLTVYVFQEQSFLTEDYPYYLTRDDQTPSASVSSQRYPTLVQNLAAIYLGDPDSVLTKAGLRVDKQEVYSEQLKGVLEAGTLYSNRLEQSSIDMIELQVYTENEPGSLINDSSNLLVSTSGGGTIEVLKEYIGLPE